MRFFPPSDDRTRARRAAAAALLCAAVLSGCASTGTDSPEEAAATADSNAPATTTPTATEPFPEAIVEQRLKDLGYQRRRDEADTWERSAGGTTLSITVTAQEISGEVAGTELRDYNSLLSDIATVINDHPYSHSDWEDIEAWLTKNQDAATDFPELAVRSTRHSDQMGISIRLHELS